MYKGACAQKKLVHIHTFSVFIHTHHKRILYSYLMYFSHFLSYTAAVFNALKDMPVVYVYVDI